VGTGLVGTSTGPHIGGSSHAKTRAVRRSPPCLGEVGEHGGVNGSTTQLVSRPTRPNTVSLVGRKRVDTADPSGWGSSQAP